MQRFEFEDVPIAYERKGAGPAVLFLHNGGTSGRIWRSQFESLSDSHDVVAVDLPGFGESPLPATPMDLARYVRAIDGLIEGLTLAPVSIVGNCMGSNIATGVAESSPEKVTSLVLINPLTRATFDAGWIGPLHKLDGWAPPVAKVLRSVSRRVRTPRLAAPTVLRFQLGPAGTEKGLHHDPELVACNTRADQLPALVDILEDMDSYGQLDLGRDIPDIPIMTLWGAKNRVLSFSKGKKLNVSLRPARELVLKRSGHLPMLEEPDAVTAAIRDFLR